MGLVIDTNVFEHSENAIEQRRDESAALLIYIRDTPAQVIYVDNDVSFDRSMILSEYRVRLVPGNFAHTLLLTLIKNNKVIPLSRSVSPSISKKIRTNIFDNSDIIFLKVAYNSVEKLFASHDYLHIPEKRRTLILDEINVRVLCASQCMAV